MSVQIIARPAAGPDLPAILKLLAGAGLPTQGVSEGIARRAGRGVGQGDGRGAGRRADRHLGEGSGEDGTEFLVLDVDGRIVAVAGVEVHGRSGLLRSVVVNPAERGRGYARQLCERLAMRARGQGLEALYLLTLDAEEYFARLDFRRLERHRAPVEIRACREFRELCPDSATLMRRALD